MSVPHKLPKQQGIALITVLLVLAVVTVVLVSMSSSRQFDIRRTQNQLRSNQAWEYLHAMEAWAKGRLQEDFDKNKFDAAKDVWDKPLKPKSIPGGTLEANITELQGRINLNNLLVEGKPSEQDVQRLKRLFVYLDIKPELIEPILDWMDEDQEIRYPEGAEDETYTALLPPYRSANRIFADVNELLKVQGVTVKDVHKLQNYIYVAKDYEQLNINTASAVVLRCLADDISKDKAESIYRANGKPFDKVDEFLKDEAMAGIEVNKDTLGVTSKHFLVSGKVEMDNNALVFQSQLYRDKEGKVSIITRSRRSPFYE
ncbi:MAG: type II secretion system minor pseudopilin GspK [Methylococcaceae bacterium]